MLGLSSSQFDPKPTSARAAAGRCRQDVAGPLRHPIRGAAGPEMGPAQRRIFLYFGDGLLNDFSQRRTFREIWFSDLM
jgi:hypothetical protein